MHQQGKCGIPGERPVRRTLRRPVRNTRKKLISDTQERGSAIDQRSPLLYSFPLCFFHPGAVSLQSPPHQQSQPLSDGIAQSVVTAASAATATIQLRNSVNSRRNITCHSHYTATPPRRSHSHGPMASPYQQSSQRSNGITPSALPGCLFYSLLRSSSLATS